ENVDYPELIWEDLAYQIGHRKEKRSRRKNIPYPHFTKTIINHFLKQHKSPTNLNHKHYHTIKDDGIVSRLKFAKTGEDYQEYGHPISDVMLTDAIKRSESYQMFIKYLTHHIPPKKSKGKGSKGKKTAKDQTEAKEVEAARKVHATHARIVTEFVSESNKKKSSGISSKSVVIQDTPSAPNSKTATSKTKLKGTSSKPGVPNESTFVSATSSEGTGAKLGVSDKDKDITEEKVILEWGDEQDSEHSDDDNYDVEKDERMAMLMMKAMIMLRMIFIRKEEAEKTSEAKDDSKKTELPPSSLSLCVSFGFGDPFLKLSFDSSLVSTVKDSSHVDVNSLLDIPIQHETPQIQVAKLEKDVFELKTINLFFEGLAVLQSQVPAVVGSYLDTEKPKPIAKQESEKSHSEILKIKKEQDESQENPHFTINSTDKAALEEYDLKSDKGVVNTVKDHKRKHDDDEDDDDEDPLTEPNQGKKTKRRRTKESASYKKPSSTKETPKGKTMTKGFKSGKSALAKEPVEEPIPEMIMDDASDDLVHDDDQPQAASKPKTSKTLNLEWCKQPPWPPAPDPEWNKRLVVLDQPI
nr:hypothetical protein [Tanacetum cinerariifolium]